MELEMNQTLLTVSDRTTREGRGNGPLHLLKLSA